MTRFGAFVRDRREKLRRDDRRYSLRQVAARIGIEPAYLSKIERGDVAPPSEATTARLARELDVDRDMLLALGGKVSSDLKEILRRRPRLFAELIRQLKEAPDDALLRTERITPSRRASDASPSGISTTTPIACRRRGTGGAA
ncbi:MAG: helix-turn-helix transcriptional regulator [Gammaproteobacteria bacterium]|nr:helix-turn-helix transcriptional regulator [Gammaproteobacteria bacterium]